MKCAIVILNWNTKDYLRKFLPGVIKSAGADVVVADNASTDGSVELLRSEFPSVRRIELDKNYGFTGGYNRAIATLEGYDLFVLMNTDIEAPEGWLEPLLDWMETHPGCGICAPKLHSLYNREQFEYAGAAGGFIDSFGYPFCRGRVLKRVEMDEGQYDEASPRVFWTTGACLMVRSKLWEELGGLDERFFAHMEEIDFCWRAAIKGYSICIVPASTVYHLGGGTLPNDSPFKLKLNFRNSLLMLRNNMAKTKAIKYVQAGYSPEEAAKRAVAVAGTIIFARKILDGAAALVYLFSGKIDCFKAVFQAHKEYRNMKGGKTGRKALEAFIKESETVRPSGFYKGCMPLQALLRGDRIFSYIRRVFP